MEKYRPGYHYQPAQNWMNDPNGLVFHEGLYHLYYQYNPNGDRWGDIHWGHAVSKDLVHWETRPIAMKPALEQGEIHCFSGCACKNKQGEPVFYYTSIGSEQEGRGGKHGAQQWIAHADADLNTLTQTDAYAMLPGMHGNLNVLEWRDPYVTRYRDGFLMALGCRLEERGACLLYTSEDGLQFAFHSVLARSEDPKEYTWECPNFFPMGDKYVLLYSPNAAPKYIIGTLTDDLRFVSEHSGVLDASGWDGFYAPQSFEDESGRRIVFGWMTDSSRGEWESARGWSGSQSIPRVLSIQDGRLVMQAIEALEQLKTPDGCGALPLARPDAGMQYCLEAEAELEPEGELCVGVLCSPDSKEETLIRVKGSGMLEVVREKSSDFAQTRHTNLRRSFDPSGGRVKLEVYVDHSIVEVCANGEWISTQVYPSCGQSIGLYAKVKQGKGSWKLFQMADCRK